MTKSHKVLVLVPPLLIGFTVLLTLFIMQHRANQQAEGLLPDRELATTTDDFIVTNPLPPTDTTENPSQPQTKPNNPPSPDDMVACTMDAKMCPDGSFVGRQGPNCEFAPCPSSDSSKELTLCEPGSRLAEACIEIYAPVCGQKQVQCVTTPCDPIPTTYANSCFACQDNQVIGYTEGACTTENE